eukprot:2304292-Rhodomonas_salina.1
MLLRLCYTECVVLSGVLHGFATECVVLSGVCCYGCATVCGTERRMVLRQAEQDEAAAAAALRMQEVLPRP